MQRHKKFGAWTSVLLTLFVFALKMAVFKCDIKLEENTQAKLTAVLSDAVRLNWDRILSPALIQSNLITAALGGKKGSDTQKELQLAAQVSGSKDDLAEKLQELSVATDLENYFYVNKNLKLASKFEQRTNYIPAYYVKFSEEQTVATRINDLVANRTKNQLQKDKFIVKEETIDYDTTLIALDLINFSAKWETPFIASTDIDKLMYNYGTFLYGKVEGLNATAVVLPFKQSKTRMLFVFADETDKLVPLRNRLMSVDVTKIPSVLSYTRTDIFLPGFSFETVFSLFTETLGKMKIKEALTGDAHFDEFFIEKELSFLRSFDQFSSIKVDMNGVQFASATSALYELTSNYQKPIMLADKDFDGDDGGRNPFFFYIINGKNILAAGSSYNGNSYNGMR